ncbi:MAG: hypothetical protein M1294_04635 [Firmicutes bacterium]|nr:hypothetical protein [Bacillota bacterium]MCL5013396.1 hypothetical protein [Bacillota bacterium]
MTYHRLSVMLWAQYYAQFVRPVRDVNEELERWMRVQPWGNPVRSGHDVLAKHSDYGCVNAGLEPAGPGSL